MGSEEAEERVLGNLDQSRRAFLKKLILGTAFVVPAVTSFTMGGLDAEQAHASTPNQFAVPGTPGAPNCIGQTVAYIEHPSSQVFLYADFIGYVRYLEANFGLPQETGVWAIATQYCRYGAFDSCFTAGTLVTLADGTARPIEQIAAGDLVLSGDGRANRVVEVERPQLGLRRLYALNGSGFFVTAEHPFMTDDGWKSIDPAALAAEGSGLAAGRLAVGDRLHRLAGVLAPVGAGAGAALEVEIEAVRLERMESRAADPTTPLYNLRLDGDHTYFADHLLVHNK